MDANIVALGGGWAVAGGQCIMTSLNDAESDAVKATHDSVTLLTEYIDGSCVKGPRCASAARRRIRRVSLTPGRVRATPEAVQAIAGAEAIVLGPASLYSALLPTLLVRGIAGAIAASRAPIMLVMNLMTEPGETDGYSGADFVLGLRRHVKQLPMNLTVVVNDTPVPELVAARYARAGQFPINVDDATLSNLGCAVVRANLLADSAMARHDIDKLTRALRALTPVTLQ